MGDVISRGSCPPETGDAQRHEFTEPITGETRTLVIPAGGRLFGAFGSKIGIEHPGCMVLADLSLELDAFYCMRCRTTGRVSGAWCSGLIEASL